MSDVETKKTALHHRHIRSKDGTQSEWRDEARRALGKIIVDTVWPDELIRSCLSCIHFKETLKECDKFKVEPPPRIIAFGCNEYFDEAEIPY